MRSLHRVSSVVASLLFAGTAAAQPSTAPVRGKSVMPLRSRQALASGPSSRRTTGSSPRERPQQLTTNAVVMRSHRIVRGDSLSGIAALYGTSVQALAAANGLRPEEVIRTGQELVIPQQARPGGGNDWLKYAHSPEQPGRLDLWSYHARFKGQVIEKGHLLASARRDISELLGATGPRPPVPDRLLRLLVRVSDTFGGRMIRVVSGYRTSSFFADSRHKHSAAVDFSIAGVPNAIVRQYLLMFDDVGVGYYPNSSFVHMDVRNGAMQWVDYAGPGEAPRLHPHAPRFAQAPSVSDLDEIAENVAAAMDSAAPSHTASAAAHALDDIDTASDDDGAHGEAPHAGSSHAGPSHTEAMPDAAAHGETTRGEAAHDELSRGPSVRGEALRAGPARSSASTLEATHPAAKAAPTVTRGAAGHADTVAPTDGRDEPGAAAR